MKKFVFITILLIFTTVTYAQQLSGSFQALAGAGRAKVEVDYSKVSIHGMTEADFAIYEKDWMVDKDDITDRFIGKMQDKFQTKLLLGNFPNAKYTIVIQVLVFTTNGSCTCDVVLLDEENNELGRIANLSTYGGSFGTKLYQIKLGAEHTGEDVGRLLLRAMQGKKLHFSSCYSLD